MTTNGPAATTEPKPPSIFDKPSPSPITLDISSVYNARRAATPAGDGNVVGGFLFVVLIGVAVAAAGFIGIAVWGPEKKATPHAAMDTQPTPSFALPVAPSMTAPAVSTAEPTPPPPAESSASETRKPPAKKGRPTMHAPRATVRPKP